MVAERRVGRTCPQGGEELPGCLPSARELVFRIPPPGRDHRKDEDAALVEQRVIDAGIALADLVRDVGEVELDRTPTSSLEVNEQRAVLGVEDVPGVWLAVQQLLRGTSPGDHGHHATERVHEKVTVGVAELRSPVAAPDEQLSFPDPIREMRRRDIDVLHADVKPRERVSVVGWSELASRLGLVVGPERDREAVALVDPRRHSWIEKPPRDCPLRPAVPQGRPRTLRPRALGEPHAQERRMAAGAPRACSRREERSPRRPSGRVLRRSTWPQPPRAVSLTPALPWRSHDAGYRTLASHELI